MGNPDGAAVQNAGIGTRSPPFMADWWAQMPTIVQLAEVGGVGQGRLLAEDGHQEVVGQVRVAAAVAAALEEDRCSASWIAPAA